MIDGLVGFVEELRAVGVPVSMVEAIDAAEVLRHVDLGDRIAVQEGLAAALVKAARHRPAFDLAFEVYFGLTVPQDVDESDSDDGGEAMPPGTSGGGGGAGAPSDDASDLVEALFSALRDGDRDGLLRGVRSAVSRLAGMEPGRPVGGRYYLYRVMRRLDVDALRARLAAGADGLDGRLEREAVDERIEELVTEVRREITRRLVADRGVETVAKTLRQPLVEDLDLTHATRDELAQIERVIQPLARKLASRMAQRRRRGRDGRPDVRATIRRSLSHGGVMLDPRFKPPRRSKPELVVICDVSGSMATFARFTMQLVYAIGHQFSKVRAFAFIDALDEVTDYFTPGVEFHDALLRMGREAHLVWQDGHSDYGHSIENFYDRYRREVTPRTTLLVTGDARNNYRPSAVEMFAELASTARRTYWLNPEPRRYWDTGDSIMGTYAPYCDGVYEVRTLRQLEYFVEDIAWSRSPAIGELSLK